MRITANALVQEKKGSFGVTALLGHDSRERIVAADRFRHWFFGQASDLGLIAQA
jgi:hypothetical protein